MKMIKMPSEEIRNQTTEILQNVLLDRVIKLKKLSKEMTDNVHVQKAHDALMAAKAPFKRTRSKWIAEIEVIELELRARNVKFNISWDDIYQEEEGE